MKKQEARRRILQFKNSCSTSWMVETKTSKHVTSLRGTCLFGKGPHHQCNHVTSFSVAQPRFLFSSHHHVESQSRHIKMSIALLTFEKKNNISIKNQYFTKHFFFLPVRNYYYYYKPNLFNNYIIIVIMLLVLSLLFFNRRHSLTSGLVWANEVWVHIGIGIGKKL